MLSDACLSHAIYLLLLAAAAGDQRDPMTQEEVEDLVLKLNEIGVRAMLWVDLDSPSHRPTINSAKPQGNEVNASFGGLSSCTCCQQLQRLPQGQPAAVYLCHQAQAAVPAGWCRVCSHVALAGSMLLIVYRDRDMLQGCPGWRE